METMRRIVAAVVVVVACVAHVNADVESSKLIPLPKQVDHHTGWATLSRSSKIVVRNKSLLPLAKVLTHNIFMQTGVTLTGTSDGGSPILLLTLYAMLVALAAILMVRTFRRSG